MLSNMRLVKFMSWRWWYLGISSLLIATGVASLVMWRLKPSIDFTGGSLLVVQVADLQTLQPVSRENIQSKIGSTYQLSSVQQSGSTQLVLRGEPISNQQKDQILAELTKAAGVTSEVRFETVGPTLGKELLIKMITAIVLVAAFITVYVWRQFREFRYGICAILAMFHDTSILLGSFSLLGHFYNVEVDVLFVTAVLTTLSFSVHDTIVVYDRIREILRKHPRLDFSEAADAAVLQTLSRSVNNSFTIIIMLLALVLLGGETIRWFAVALLIGAITGTYSSTFTAVPLLLVWEEFRQKFKKRR